MVFSRRKEHLSHLDAKWLQRVVQSVSTPYGRKTVEILLTANPERDHPLHGEVTQQDIVGAMRQAKFFALWADVATDISNVEQMPVIVRYVNKEHEVKEDFPKFIGCSSTSGSTTATHLTDFVTGVGLDMSCLREQGYDGAESLARGSTMVLLL